MSVVNLTGSGANLVGLPHARLPDIGAGGRSGGRSIYSRYYPSLLSLTRCLESAISHEATFEHLSVTGSPKPSVMDAYDNYDSDPEAAAGVRGSTASSMKFEQAGRDAIEYPSTRRDDQSMEDGRATPPVPELESVPEQFYDRDSRLMNDLFDAGKAGLFYTLTRKENGTAPKTSVINIATLQDLALRELQYEIAFYVHTMFQRSRFVRYIDNLPDLSDLMKKYCKLHDDHRELFICDVSLIQRR